MKVVKLVAKADTWFKKGTEVYEYGCDYEDKQRVTLDYWEKCKSEGGICVRGIRVCEEGYEQNYPIGRESGEERIDGEYCRCDEFEATIIDE